MAKQELELGNLLELDIDRFTKRISNRESEHREFKLKFENKNLPKLAKAMASFSNRDGGVIFFGIKDRPRELVGVLDHEIPDDVVFTNFVKEYFEPEITFESKTFEALGLKVHCLIVKPSTRKPVICRKSKSIRVEQGTTEKEILREGAIYYRYSASSDEIKYADLRNILDNEREQYFKSLVDSVTLINKVGVDKAAIVNAQELSGDDQSASVYLTNDTAKNLNWIDKGRFTEDKNQGGKAYYVVRKVEIKHGIEVPIPTDYAKTHPLTKTALSKKVKISPLDFDAVIWKLGIKDNLKFHFSSYHGKNPIHKFTEACTEIILKALPLEMEKRRDAIKVIAEEYKAALRL